MVNAFTIAIFLVVLMILGLNLFTYLKRTGAFLFATSENATQQVGSVVKTVGGSAVGAVEGGVQGAIHSAQYEMGIEQSPDDVVKSARESIQLKTFLPHRSELKNLTDTKRESELGKDGYCLVGQDGMDGIPRRACIRVGVNDRCLSNKIYPTMDVCVNPALRA